MDLGMAILADGFQVCHVPCIIVEVGLADADLKWTDNVVNLVARCDTAFLEAFLA